jgi:hypothetical protein
MFVSFTLSSPMYIALEEFNPITDLAAALVEFAPLRKTLFPSARSFVPAPVLVAVVGIVRDVPSAAPNVGVVKLGETSVAKVPVALGNVIVAVTASTGVSVVDPLVAPAKTTDPISMFLYKMTQR